MTDTTRFQGEYGAYVFQLWAPEPVFHRCDRDRDHREPGDDVWRDWTACGRLISSYDPAAGRVREVATMLPAHHAVKIGRPCRRCFEVD
jgi:hypothetical protein